MANQTRKFAVVLEPEEEGGFTVRVPSLPEIVTYGEDEQEALAMAEDAIRLVIENCVARCEPIPTPQMPRIREITVTLATWPSGCRPNANQRVRYAIQAGPVRESCRPASDRSTIDQA